MTIQLTEAQINELLKGTKYDLKVRRHPNGWMEVNDASIHLSADSRLNAARVVQLEREVARRCAMNKKPVVILLREGFWNSLICDTYTFGCLAALFWFNHSFIGGSHFVNAIILFCWMMFLFSRAARFRHEFYDKESAIKAIRKGLRS